MANPMQKKSRRSFILGILVAVILMGMVVAFLLLQISKLKQQEEERIAAQVKIYALNQDVKSGQLITPNMLTQIQIDKGVIPSNAVQNVDQYFLADQDGNTVETVINEETEEPVTCVNIDGQQYPIENLDGDSGTITINGQSREIKIEGLPAMAKIDMTKNTILTSDSISESFEIVSNSTRKQEYNMIAIPADIETDDVVDVRLRMPNGTDYIVVSKKRITVLDLGTTSSLSTISLELDESETLMMSNAIVESYIMEGSRLYISRYVEAGIQEASVATYIPSDVVINLVNSNPNIVQEAKNAMITRYNENATQIRGDINNEISKIEEDQRETNINSGVADEITAAQEERQSYLDALAGE